MRRRLRVRDVMTIGGESRRVQLVEIGPSHIVVDVETEEHVRVARSEVIGNTDDQTKNPVGPGAEH